jgi:hypothetical protein
MMAACEGDGCAATLLAHLLYHHSNKLASAPQVRKMNDIAETHGEERTQFEGIYQWHTAKELEEGILGLYSARSIPKGLDRLEKLGFITISSNPNKKYKFDRTKYFFVHEEVIQAWVDGYVEAKKAGKNAETLTQDTTGKSARRSSEIVSQPSNNVSQSCESARAITMTTSMISSNDQEEKDTDEFFANSFPTQNQENPFPVKITPRIEETPNPKSPLSPLPPENLGKAIAPSPAVSKQAEVYKSFEQRFSQPKAQNRHAPRALIDAGYAEWHNGKHPNDWRKSLIDVCIQRKKKRGGETTVGAATDFIFNVMKDCIALSFWGKFQELVDQALKLEAAEAIATQQRQAEQQRFQQPAEDESERVDVNEVLANLKRKQLLRKSQAA